MATVESGLFQKRLAREIVAQLYSPKEAEEAGKHFEKVVQNKELPDEILSEILPPKETGTSLPQDS